MTDITRYESVATAGSQGILTSSNVRRIVWVRSSLRQLESGSCAKSVGVKEERMRLIKPIVLHCRWQVDT